MTERCKVILGHLGSQGKGLNGLSMQPMQHAAATSGGDNEQRYRYTTAGGALTDAQREAYERDGYVIIPNLVPREKLDTWSQRFREICTGKVKVPGLMFMHDISLAKQELPAHESVVSKIQNYHNDPVLFQYCRLPEVLRYAESIVGPDIVATHTMLINKPPDPGSKSSRFPLHQDLHFFPIRPPDGIVCCWTAMEKVDRQNGCLVAIPGSHRLPHVPHSYPAWSCGVNMGYYGVSDFRPDFPRSYLEMEAGDAVFFHPLLVHGSGTNKTKGFRKAITCHFASSHCHYFDTTGTIAENLKVESEKVLKVKGESLGMRKDKLAYMDFWKWKTRLVQGAPAGLP